MAGGGCATSGTQESGQRRRKQTTSLPLDALVDIATRTDPATLVRCATTCIDMRCRIKDDPSLRSRLRLRQGDRFVLPLLRGHLIHGLVDEELFLVDTSATDTTRLLLVTGGGFPLTSCEGLVLAHVGVPQKLCVYDLATGTILTLPSEPRFCWASWINYILLVGDNDKGVTAVGRHFQVVMAYLELSQYLPRLHLQTFSSEHGAWGRYTVILVPNLHGSCLQQGINRALVIGGDVHWLCVTSTGSYVLKLHVKASRVTVTILPKSFPQCGSRSKLLATSSASGGVLVLVADGNRILAWAQAKHTAKWHQRPQVVIETEAILRFLDKAGGSRPQRPIQFTLVWFAERSGMVLIEMSNNGFFWLDLQSMKIVRWFSNHDIPFTTKYIPYEMSLTAWVPTFSSTL